MFLVNRLFGISGQAGPAPELTTLDGGRLFLVRPDSVRGSRECIFIDATLSVRRTTHPHAYQLVVTRAFQEGEEQLLDEDAESADERSFLLDASLFLSLGPALDPASSAPTPSTSTSTAAALPSPSASASASAPPGHAISFTWLDPDGDGPDDEFEFVLPSDGTVTEQQARDFERLCWRCMWERKHSQEWPADDRDAREAERTLEDGFKVERAPAPAPAAPLYPSLPPQSAASSTQATPSRAAPPRAAEPRAPLFRATSPDSDDERDAAPSRPTTLPDSDEEDAFAEAAGAGEGEGDDDSGDELAQQLMQKATLSSSSSSKPIPSPSKSKGKGKGKAAPPVPVDDPHAPSLRPPPAPPAPSGEPTPVITVLASLHLYDRATGLFMQQDAAVRAGLYALQKDSGGGAGGGHWLVVANAENEGDVWVSQAVTADTTVNFAEREKAMVFNYTTAASSDGSEGPQTFTWLLRLEQDEAFSALQEAVSRALFEDKHGAGAWKRLQGPEQEYARKAWLEEDDEMWDAEGIDEDEREREEREREEEEREVAQELDEEEEESEPEPTRDSDDEDEDSDDDRRAPSAGRAAFSKKQPKQLAIGEKRRAKNSQLAVGYKDDLSFVVQGDMIGVFKQQREGGKKLKFVTSIVNIAGGPNNKNFAPGKVMLHNQDTSMILQNPLAPGSLYRLDLETGKVVDEYKVSDDFAVSNFLPDSKFAQTTQQQTFIGHSRNGLFRIDPRLGGSKLVESEFKQYATKADFSAAATTESGKLAVASQKGDIRLFDKLGKIAKTALPALGDAILGIDVSADGRWVLATCKTYLLLIDTLIPESSGSKYAGQSGFDRAFPAAAKPTPRRLTLKPEHVAHMQEVQGGDGVSFTPAKFNAALTGEPEKTIVTSTGPFIVAWNFRQVKSGNIHNYTLRRFSDDVVADNFKFGGDREIIVTLPENVFVEEKKKLKAPTRDSIVRTWDGH